LRNDWLEQGYQDFAEFGPEHLSINRMAKALGESRSSFYHHFGDMEIFVDELLKRHWEEVLAFNETGQVTCQNLIPDLYELLGRNEIPLKFNWQLFHHRHIPRFNYIFVKGYHSSGEAFLLRLFAEHLGIHFSHEDLQSLWLTLGEAWYSRLDPNDLSASTLKRHGELILKDIEMLMNSGLYSSLLRIR
jgi:AcrR family transcriptional regulator